MAALLRLLDGPALPPLALLDRTAPPQDHRPTGRPRQPSLQHLVRIRSLFQLRICFVFCKVELEQEPLVPGTKAGDVEPRPADPLPQRPQHVQGAPARLSLQVVVSRFQFVALWA